MPRAVPGTDAGGSDAIAIVGAACRLPGAPDLDALWDLLEHGRDAVTQVPPGRFTQGAFLHPRQGEPGKTYTFAAGTIDARGDGAAGMGDLAAFDAPHFGLSPREAAEMDPQQRLLLEVAWEALEDAGIPPSALAGAGTGTYVGASLTDWGDLRQADAAAGDRWFMTGSALSVLANRIGHVFDLRGPAQTIDTACSSSLVALHLAAEALVAGRVPAAIVGGVNLLLSPFPFLGFARAGMLSPSGRCRAFTAGADGYVRAEGAAVVILKRLADARAAGDPIHAVLLGTGTNGAGRTVGLSLPDGAAQAALMTEVMARAGVAPDDVAYFEAHGTGTPAGDPVEAGAIGGAIGRRRSTGSLPIGSIKTNIGHTEPASGLAGLLKAMLVLERGRIPPSLHQGTPNPQIALAELGLTVPGAGQALRHPGRAVVGVNSFGFGGTNACALLARGPVRRGSAGVARADTAQGPAQGGAEPGLPPLLLSARSPAALATLAQRWATRLAATAPPVLPALLRGAARHRDLLPHRLVVRAQGDATGPAAFGATLAAWRAGAAPPEASAAEAAGGTGVLFVFSGNGAQHPGMARSAMASSPAFRAGVQAADAALTPHLGWSVAEALAAGVDAASLAATERAQPLLFAVQHGIVTALAAQGIRPSLVLGHSVGEVAAASAAGVLDLAAAARVVAARSRHQAATRGMGRMAAIGIGADAIRPLLATYGCEIAAENAPRACTVAGPEAELRALLAACAERDWAVTPLDLDYAFHSRAMDPVRDGLLADLATLAGTGGPGAAPMLSSVTAAPLAPGMADAGYWWRNLRDPVRFAAAVTAAAATRPAVVLEIGPNPILGGYLRDGLAAAGIEAAILPTLTRQDPAPRGDPFGAIADRATTRGADPRGGPAFAGPAEHRLPRTPYDRRPLWWAPTSEGTRLADPVAEHPLLGHRQGAAPEAWVRHMDLVLDPWLGDHRLGPDAVLPAAALLEMALAAGGAKHPEAAVLEVTEFTILRPVTLEGGRLREIRTRLDPAGRITIESRWRLADPEWTLHAEGRVATLPALPGPPIVPGPTGDAGTPGLVTLDGAALRARAARLGLRYGPAFHGATAVQADPGAGTARVALRRPAAAPPDTGLLLHPSRLDAAFGGLLALLPAPTDDAGAGWVPIRVTRLTLLRHAQPPATAHVRVTTQGGRSAAADILLADPAGRPVAMLGGCWLGRMPSARRDPAEHAFRVEWTPAAPLPGTDPPAGPDLAAAQAAARATDARLGAGEAGSLLEGFWIARVHELLAALPEASRRRPAAQRLLAQLEEHGLAAAEGGVAHLLPATDLPAAGAIWWQALSETPDLAPELAALATAAEGLARSLTGAGAPVSAPGVSPAALGYARLAEVLAAAVQAWVACWPAERPLRVLELGAGVGGLTARVLAALAGRGLTVRYVAAAWPEAAWAGTVPTDPHAGPPGVTLDCAVWDPTGDDPPPILADLVLGLAAQARLAAGDGRVPVDLAAALCNRVAPEATLLLAEPLPGRVWSACAGTQPADAATWTATLGRGFVPGPAITLGAAPWPAVLLAARAGAGPAVLATPVARRVLLVGGAAEAPLRTALTALLMARGLTVDTAEPRDIPSPRALRGALVVALCTAVECPDLPRALADLGGLAAAAEGAGAGAAFRLVTRGGTAGDVAAAALLAAGRVLANEHPALRPRRIDLDPRLSAAALARRLLPDLLYELDQEPEVALAGTAGRRVPRLRAGLPAPRAPEGPARLSLGQAPGLHGLHWAPLDLDPPGPGEVRIRVEAAALNFRDLLWAQGALPEEVLLAGFTGPGLGMECAGVVEAVGEPRDPAATAFRSGDRVFGIAPHALSTHAVTRAAALAPLPVDLEAAAAATLPVAFLTALHALDGLARLAPGERVLVHGGAGAVGLAALQVALARGAVVAMTAGTEAKRAFLRAAGATLVLDSRDPAFADRLREAWPPAEGDGDGAVDVVLNALAGDAADRSMALLRPFGRFVELGKRDFVEDRRVALRPLRRNATWFAVDIDELPRARPAVAARLLAAVAAGVADGTLRPLPAQPFLATEAEAAFRTLQAGAHIGKLVLRPPAVTQANPVAVPVPVGAAPLEAAARGTVVVVGGTTGFGLAAAHWLAGQGVRRLALLSRRGAATPGAAAAVAALADAGAQVTLHAVDAADVAALARTLGCVRESAPITGVVHAAAVYADGTAAALDPGRARAVLDAKLGAALALDRATEADPLALFLLFGSATAAIGAPGQIAYAAANAGLEALARRRHAAGRPALCVAWGPIADAGALAEDDARAALERRLGTTARPAAAALAALPALLAAGEPVLGIVPFTGDAALPVLGEPAFAAWRTAARATVDTSTLRHRLRTATEAEALVLLRDALAQEVARILRLPSAGIAGDAPLAGLGLDSLGGMELRVGLEALLGVAVPLGAVTDALTLDGLARRIAAAVRETPAHRQAAALIEAHEPARPEPAPGGGAACSAHCRAVPRPRTRRPLRWRRRWRPAAAGPVPALVCPRPPVPRCWIASPAVQSRRHRSRSPAPCCRAPRRSPWCARPAARWASTAHTSVPTRASPARGPRSMVARCSTSPPTTISV